MTSKKAHTRWLADLSWMKKDSGETYNGSLHGNQELAWMRRKPCHGGSGPSSAIQMTTSTSPHRNASNEPVSLWMSRRLKTGHVNRGEINMKQEEHSFSPRGVALALSLALLCTDLTVNADAPNQCSGNDWKATPHRFVSNLPNFPDHFFFPPSLKIHIICGHNARMSCGYPGKIIGKIHNNCCLRFTARMWIWSRASSLANVLKGK